MTQSTVVEPAVRFRLERDEPSSPEVIP